MSLSSSGWTFDSACWETVRLSDGQYRYRCKICRDSLPHEHKNLARHEKTQKHQSTAEYRRATQPDVSGPSLYSGEPGIPVDSTRQAQEVAELNEDLIDDATRYLLASITGDVGEAPYPEDPALPGSDSLTYYDPSPVTGVQWGLASEEPREDSVMSKAAADVARATLQFLNNEELSDDEVDERPSDSEDNTGVASSFDLGDAGATVHEAKRARNFTTDPETSRNWYPWQDKITCSLDILMHLPRSVFSQKQLDLFLWILSVNGVPDVPSVTQMQDINKALQRMCGIGTQVYEGALGHRYYMNSLGDILAQEMANPKVRPDVHIYPEDTGKYRREARQSDRWLHELPAELTTPMIRIGQADDYYIYEPAMLDNDTVCMPIRWFERDGSLHGRAWRMIQAQDATTLVDGWCVRVDEELEFRASQLLKNFTGLKEHHTLFHLPSPTIIHGTCSLSAQHGITDLKPWTLTDTSLGNRWRATAKGSRVMAVPLWMYCDDTSGNVSKKWNEHNSFLFTLAGLPGEQTAREYNVHFLSTSNIAPPLEMLDGVVQQLSKSQEEGIRAWDCVLQEHIIIFPVILALLGDNPMQSEFSCHIGMHGKYFCRACWTKGSDASDSANRQEAERPDGSVHGDESVGSDGSDDGNASGTSQAGSESGAPKSKKKFKETMEAMVNRVRSFMEINRLRNKNETETLLRSYFTDAQVIGSKTKLKQRRTETGIKDTVQQHFLERLFTSYKGKHGAQRQSALDQIVAQLPKETTSPVWRVKGLDPHQDTPVEILHVVLLGFVKYFWRDITMNRLKNKDEKKKLVAQRLSGLDVSGLGISPLAGDTLVNYAGSLTGRDFRAIAQVAPFVIYDLVSDEILQAWVSLSKLIPMIWQPVIDDIDVYTTKLEAQIQDFLLRTVRWSAQWFNKPKFHVILHLPAHIRRFGPAILFATEAFESFNAVIRAKSVHSNRQAPSRDIALAFAQGNRVRHLLSGGYFIPEHGTRASKPISDQHLSHIGPGPRQLMEVSNTATSYLGLDIKEPVIPGQCKRKRDNAEQQFSQTLTSQRISNQQLSPHQECIVCESVVLVNGDKCMIGGYVIVRCPPPEVTFLACVREILQVKKSLAALDGKPDGVLLQSIKVVSTNPKYEMPQLEIEDRWHLVSAEDLLCTVNMQHNCASHGCSPSGLRYIYQERAQTTRTVPVVEHLQSPNDLILNVAQMRDAALVQQYSPPFDQAILQERETIIMKSCATQIETKKSTQVEKTKHADKGKAPTRGRGRGRGSRLRGT